MKEHIYKKRKPTEEFVCLLNQHGFNINKIYNEQFDYKFTDASAMFNHFLIMLAFIGSWKEIISQERHEEIFEETELRLNNQAAKNGFLQLTIPFVLVDCKRSEQTIK